MKYIFTLLTLLLFLGCSDTANETQQQEAVTTNVIEMEQDRSYTVNKGDRLDRTSEPTEISIDRNIQDDTTTVILLSGSAQIIRAN